MDDPFKFISNNNHANIMSYKNKQSNGPFQTYACNLPLRNVIKEY